MIDIRTNFFTFITHFISFFTKHKADVVNVGFGLLVSTQYIALINSFVANIIIPIVDGTTGSKLVNEEIKIGKIHIKIGAFIKTLLNFIFALYTVYLVCTTTEFIPLILNKASKTASDTFNTINKASVDTFNTINKVSSDTFKVKKI